MQISHTVSLPLYCLPLCPMLPKVEWNLLCGQGDTHTLEPPLSHTPPYCTSLPSLHIYITTMPVSSLPGTVPVPYSPSPCLTPAHTPFTFPHTLPITHTISLSLLHHFGTPAAHTTTTYTAHGDPLMTCKINISMVRKRERREGEAKTFKEKEKKRRE